MPNRIGHNTGAALEVIADADLRMEWADHHIEHFDREIEAFHASASYRLVQNVDPQNPNLLHAVDPPPIPPQMNLIVSDAVHSMRVALDYLACALAVLNGASRETVSFPIAPNAATFGMSKWQDKIAMLSPEAKAFVAGVRPYKGGDNNLWAVNEINKTDKHRNLVLLNEAAPMAYFTRRQGSAQLFDFRIALVPGFAQLEGFEGQSVLTLVKDYRQSVGNVLKDARLMFFPGTKAMKVFAPRN